MKKKDFIISIVIVIVSITAFFIWRELLRNPLVSNEYDEVVSISVNNKYVEDDEIKEELFLLLKSVYSRTHALFQPCMCFKVENTEYYIDIDYNDGSSERIYVTDLRFIARPLSSGNGHRPPLVMSYSGYDKVLDFLNTTEN